jgi:hypothetical protein
MLFYVGLYLTTPPLYASHLRSTMMTGRSRRETEEVVTEGVQEFLFNLVDFVVEVIQRQVVQIGFIHVRLLMGSATGSA